MALPTLEWRRLPDQTPSGNTTTDLLDAIKAAFASATYHDGSVRTAGSDIAWSLDASEGTPTEAISFQPPSGSGCSARVCFAALNGAAPTMQSPDTWQNNRIFTMYSSTGGTLSGWQGVTPFGAGERQTGFIATSINVTGAAGTVWCYESTEAICVMFKNGTSIAGVIVGAIFDPKSSDPLDAESDDRLYGHLTSGDVTISLTFWELEAGWLGVNQGSNGARKLGYLQPGTSTVGNVNRNIEEMIAAMSNSRFKLPSGAYWTESVSYYDNGSQSTIGELRSISVMPRSRQGRTLKENGNVFGYAIGGSSTGDCNCACLLY